MPTTTAQQQRAILANAHASWFANRSQTNLCQTLKQTGLIAINDILMNIRLEGTTVCVAIDGGECLELDAYGNILRGMQ